MTVELNKFPFTESSTMLLDDHGYRFPLGVMVDAMFYPKCQNNPPYTVSSINKSGDIVEFTVSDNTGSPVFTIEIPLNTEYKCDFIAGIGRQGGYYCGGCLFSSSLMGWLDSMTNVSAIPADSLVFCQSTIFPQGGEPDILGSVKYNGKPVSSITWGANIAPSSSSSSSGTAEGEETYTGITALIVNGVELTGDSVYITPKKNSIIRAINHGDISIGRIDYL